MKTTEKIQVKIAQLEEIRRIMKNLHENDVYLSNSIKEYEQAGIDNLSAWELDTYNENCARVKAIEVIESHLEKLI